MWAAMLLVHPDVPAKSVSEFVALAKAKPGELQYASGGVGSFQHLGGELFKLSAGVDMLHVPFKGGGPAMIDVLGGHSKVVFATTITALPQGENATVEKIVLRFPGVTQDSAPSGAYHVRNEHANVQTRINGIMLPVAAACGDSVRAADFLAL